MPQLLRILAFLVLLACPAIAQAPNFPQTMPPDTVYGRLGIGSGPGQAIPFATLGGAIGAGAAIATPAALAAANLPGSQTSVFVAAMGGGPSTCGLTFLKGTSTPTGIFGEVLNATSGIYWEPQYSKSPVKACEFGTVGDATISQVTSAVAGTDNTSFIQAALNYALQNRFSVVCLNEGAYRTSDTLHMGWGESFYDIGLNSCSDGRATFNVAGPAIYTTVTDRCAINIQGSRTSNIKGINLAGQNLSYFFFGGMPSVFPTTPTGWLNPAITPSGTNPGGLQRYSPYGGICTDAYSGVPPSTLGAFGNYPIVTNYPAFTGLSSTAVSISNASPAVVTWPGSPSWLSSNCQFGPLQFYADCPIVFTSGTLPAALSLNTYYYVSQVLSATTFTISATPGGAQINTASAASGVSASRQYGMATGSNVLIEDSDIEGFAVNVSFNASTNQSQGDFHKINRSNLSNCVYCVSLGNDQSRNFAIEDTTFAFTHSFFTNNKFGEQVGKMGGPMSNISGGQSYQIFDIGGLSFGFPLLISQLYTEATIRIGTIDVGSGGNSVTFDGCDLEFANNLLPVAYLETPTGGSFYFRNCNFVGTYNRIDTLAHGSANITWDGGSFHLGVGSLSTLNLPGIMVAYNYTGGVLLSGNASSFPESNKALIKWVGTTSVGSMTGQASFAAALMGTNVDFNSWGARAPVTQATRGYYDTLNNQWREFSALPQRGSANLSSGTYTSVAASLACDVLTFTYLASQMASSNQPQNMNPGDILYWTGDGTIFVVTNVAVSGPNYAVTARQMNNMVIGYPGTYLCVTNNINDPTLNGNTLILHTAGTTYSSVTPIGALAPGGIMVPAFPFYGDFANGSTTVKNVSYKGPTGDGTTLTTYVKPGDIIWGFLYSDPGQNWPFPFGETVATVTNGGAGPLPGSLTMSGAVTGTGRFPISPLPINGVGIARESLPIQLFAALPACQVGILGITATVTDSTTAVANGVIAGGGANKVRAVCNSANNWVVQFAL